MSFINDTLLSIGPWQALERNVARLMQHAGWEDVRIVGQSNDRGADIIGHRKGKRWLVQVKFRRNGNVGIDVVDKTIEAAHFYNADFPVIATNQMFTDEVIKKQSILLASQIKLQLWDKYKLKRDWDRLTEISSSLKQSRKYQENPINQVINAYNSTNKALIVLATGLGKTFVAAESTRKILNLPNPPKKVLVLAHTNELVYQLEKSFWPFMTKNITSTVWNGYEKGYPKETNFTFACVDSIVEHIRRNGDLPTNYDMIIIDECHHAGSMSYKTVLEATRAGKNNGAFLLGMTATPWRSDDKNIEEIFGEKLVNLNIVDGLRNGYLSNIDYRMYVDNINWERLSELHELTPRKLNRTLFIREWDDAVIYKLKETWNEVEKPRVIVFCSTIDHAMTMRDKINSLGIGRAEAIYSGNYSGHRLTSADRNRLLADFHNGYIQVMCAVDIFNEGVDVPDVNIIVFQRVTHSRRIFIQQLGRGLRVSPGKEKVIVLDFVSDIRRFAAGLELKNSLEGSPIYLNLGNPVKFMNVVGEDKAAESFLKEWLEDVSQIQDAKEEDHILKFPPALTDRQKIR
ncbi:DEAD/DEAH box helicase family protein [Mesobacillus sp. AQ2]|uniref:DEAD/DEAH box helicase family protein n=1 Tax=Mesobacillus sp. AQ2 TaxID=3043332 RepID=UPI0024C1D24D|nr:DEAD/DEAH box helicase family protein [Mesobacillus sp. AQ2]WHX42661.1 DEAD/DEAH box helicase family protein [Mesobacillus sp. AQ2]